jgi:hypothetical protein
MNTLFQTMTKARGNDKSLTVSTRRNSSLIQYNESFLSVRF